MSASSRRLARLCGTLPSRSIRAPLVGGGPTYSCGLQTPSTSDEADLGRHFYLNKLLESYASRPAVRMTLRQLIFFGKTLSTDRSKILKSGNYVRTELPVRIAHRIRDLQALPFVVMTNKHLTEVYNKYWKAFETLRRFPVIKSMEDNERFCELLKKALDEHLTIIPSLTVGVVESSHHLEPAQTDRFMERMLRSRISRRVLAEQHIALSEALDDPFHFFNEPRAEALDDEEVGDHVGIIYTHLSVASVVNKGIRLLQKPNMPQIIVDGDLGARFAYIPEHLEYIVFELLKNAMRATERKHGKDGVVRVTIVEGPPEEDLVIRISDNGGGLPNLLDKLQEKEEGETYPIPFPDTGHVGGHPIPASEDPLIDALCSFSTVRRRLSLPPSPGLSTPNRYETLRNIGTFKGTLSEGTGPAALQSEQETGLGLPMAKVYCDFFGGSLSFRSLDGWSTDVYVRLPKLGTNKESIEDIVL